MTQQSELPWNFEAFRRFLTYDVLRNAASVITLFDGIEISNDKKLNEFQQTLNARTGISWEPSRQNSEDVLFSTEGTVFRNKARVLKSMFLIEPTALDAGSLKSTPFAKKMASGRMSQDEFYDFIITRYQYPHPGYNDNWNAWSESGIKLHPLIFILQILKELYLRNPLAGYISTDEFARFAHSNPNHNAIKQIVDEILKFRDSPDEYPKRTRSDTVDRKINDIFGFLCMTKYVYYHGQNIVLNLVRLNPDEKVFYYANRTGAKSVLDEIEEVIQKGLPNE